MSDSNEILITPDDAAKFSGVLVRLLDGTETLDSQRENLSTLRYLLDGEIGTSE
ncbi:hypothetical protein [Clavibacter sp. VKM Ac-2542]|jgi:hypothetical protein|uniref:hypothetical protein n=1 Tax=Clavibacter sp. VKM Ac-2542 TaxID=2783811 RepID=UPI00188B57A9|nr:hypothetical protein [Clavibacter sp. VKM Ac-2542]MBF4621509.1 hypothetical protein [Clavibacter sp. VKM Ac-2542]